MMLDFKNLKKTDIEFNQIVDVLSNIQIFQGQTKQPFSYLRKMLFMSSVSSYNTLYPRYKLDLILYDTPRYILGNYTTGLDDLIDRFYKDNTYRIRRLIYSKIGFEYEIETSEVESMNIFIENVIGSKYVGTHSYPTFREVMNEAEYMLKLGYITEFGFNTIDMFLCAPLKDEDKGHIILNYIEMLKTYIKLAKV